MTWHRPWCQWNSGKRQLRNICWQALQSRLPTRSCQYLRWRPPWGFPSKGGSRIGRNLNTALQCVIPTLPNLLIILLIPYLAKSHPGNLWAEGLCLLEWICSGYSRSVSWAVSQNILIFIIFTEPHRGLYFLFHRFFSYQSFHCWLHYY